MAASDERVTLSKVGPDADFIGASDEVVLLDEACARGILVDVEGGEACVRRASDGTLTYCSFERVAHPDSPQAEAHAMHGEIAPHDCDDNAVQITTDGPIGHGWECGVCGNFLQAG